MKTAWARIERSYWRDFVMWVGVAFLIVAMFIVGKEYANHTLAEIFDGDGRFEE